MVFRSDSDGQLNGFLDAGSEIHGELRFEDTFRVDGKVFGKVSSKGDLVVGEGGVVDGEVNVGRVYVSGTVKGHIDVERRVEIHSRGRVFAEVTTPSLVVEEGAVLEGVRVMAGAGAVSDAKSSKAEVKPLRPVEKKA